VDPLVEALKIIKSPWLAIGADRPWQALYRGTHNPDPHTADLVCVAQSTPGTPPWRQSSGGAICLQAWRRDGFVKYLEIEHAWHNVERLGYLTDAQEDDIYAVESPVNQKSWTAHKVTRLSEDMIQLGRAFSCCWMDGNYTLRSASAELAGGIRPMYGLGETRDTIQRICRRTTIKIADAKEIAVLRLMGVV
jgi:hypothetical protein